MENSQQRLSPLKIGDSQLCPYFVSFVSAQQVGCRDRFATLLHLMFDIGLTMEWAWLLPGVSITQVVRATEANLTMPDKVAEMAL